MAIYHLHVKVIGRRAGSSAVASAAYRSASRLRDDRLDRVQDFSAKRGVFHSEVMLPENAPEQWSDRERLWNDVEAFEVGKDAQLTPAGQNRSESRMLTAKLGCLLLAARAKTRRFRILGVNFREQFRNIHRQDTREGLKGRHGDVFRASFNASNVRAVNFSLER